MTRFAIDAHTALRLVADDVAVAEGHELVAPNVLRSQVLSLLYRAVRRGDLSRDAARVRLERLASLRMRLLGDRVSRAVAWELAEQLDLDDTADAEFLAVARLQADALVALDPGLARHAEGVVAVAPFEALLLP
ncbi:MULTISPECIES: type II toxin-antitoxin system VapC family toxin [unclassified Agromyces]|uniref:type II toxin-antitoxin system VapC family toxin n=1 Tax=unclassified Agromyces TaxID=2639701 RepID=UPI0030151D0A